MVGKITPINSSFCPRDSKIVISLIFCIFLAGFFSGRQGTSVYNFNSGSRLNLLCWMLFGYFIKEKWKFSIINFMYFEVFGHSTKLHGSIKNWWVEGQIYISDDFDQIFLLINFTYMNRQYSDLQKIIYYPIEILFVPELLNLILWYYGPSGQLSRHFVNRLQISKCEKVWRCVSVPDSSYWRRWWQQ